MTADIQNNHNNQTSQNHQTPAPAGEAPAQAAATAAKNVVGKAGTGALLEKRAAGGAKTATTTPKLLPNPTANAVKKPASSPAAEVAVASKSATKPAPAKVAKVVKAVKAVNPTAKAATKPALPFKKTKLAVPPLVRAEKPKKAKLVRDSFTIPKAEYLVLEELKLRSNKLMNPAKKSELLRAGIKALAAMTDSALLTALKQVPAIKTGRPAGKA